VKPREEALEWVKRWPASDADGNVELERVADDFARLRDGDHSCCSSTRVRPPSMQLGRRLRPEDG
jgi:hypothetical protein